MGWDAISTATIAAGDGAALTLSTLLRVLDSVLRGLSLPVAAGLFLDQADEIFVDANYLLRGLHRRERRLISWKALDRVPQKHVAIWVPAWREAEVIRRMLEHNLANIDHDRARYTFFCGTYANDPETQHEIEVAARRFPGVRKVVVPHDGPTSKADCLNWIYQGTLLEEQRRGRPYDVLLMHDANDVIHPLSLRLYSLLIPRYALVQLPVLSLNLGLRQGVGATYLDTLAERHLKDILVREAIGGLIPPAGVGCAFHRDAFVEVARAHGERPFNVESLTEDYEIALKFRLAGKRAHFACHALEATPRPEVDPPLPGRPKGPRGREEIIATRESFPDGVQASVQRGSRRILGTALQTWRQMGWPGSLPVLYSLWRDRKVLFTSGLVLLAYLLVGYGALRVGAEALGLPAGRLSVPGWRGQALRVLMIVNLVALGWRMAVKARLVAHLYGLGHALLSAPRMLLASLLDLGATGRAVWMFCKHRLTGRPLNAAETLRTFPSSAALRARQRRLGEILTEEYGLDPESLETALSLQQAVARPLGEVLSLMGMVSEQTVTRALAQLHEMAEGDPWAGTAPDHLLAALGEEEAERLGVVPIASAPDGGVRIAAEAPLDAEATRLLEERFGTEVEIVLAPPAAIKRCRQQAYRRILAGVLDTSITPISRQRVRPEEVDWEAVVRIGHGYCAFYAILPLLPVMSRDDADARPTLRPLAAAFPVHPEVLATVAHRLGADPSPRDRDRDRDRDRGRGRARERAPDGGLEVEVIPAPLLDIDVAMALAPSAAVAHIPAGTQTLELLRALETNAESDPRVAACARAGQLGLPITSSTGAGPVHWAVLPAELQGRDPIFIHGLAERSLILSTASPSPRLARTVGNLYPRWAIAWRVELPDAQPTKPVEEPTCTTRTPRPHHSMNN